MNREPKVAVIHWGARMRYGILAALASEDLLHVAYTDVHAEASRVTKLFVRAAARVSKRAAQVAARQMPDAVPHERVKAYPGSTIRDIWVRSRGPVLGARDCRAKGIGGHDLGRLAARRGFDGADVLVCRPCTCYEAIVAARESGRMVVLDAISMPLLGLIEHREEIRWGRPPSRALEDVCADISCFMEEVRLSDIVLAASPYVARGLRWLGVEAGKIEVVPYGMPAVRNGSSDPIVGRVVYLGRVTYGKGVQYLAEAARTLRDSDTPAEIVVAGRISPTLQRRPEFEGPRYLGHLPYGGAQELLASADVLVFPTLSDGFGLVQLEAMRLGIPVVATSRCGAVVSDGSNGFVVRARSGDAIAAAVGRVIDDRPLRSALSAGSKHTAKAHSLSSYAQRLSELIRRRYRGEARAR